MGRCDGSKRDQGKFGFEKDNESDNLFDGFHWAFERRNDPLLEGAIRQTDHSPVDEVSDARYAMRSTRLSLCGITQHLVCVIDL